MKKTVVMLAAAAVLFVSSAASATQFGPFIPAAQEENAALGLGYFYFSDKWEPENREIFSDIKTKQHRAYLQVSYGFMEDWEVYLRVGGATLKADEAFGIGDTEFDGGGKVFGTVGLRGAVEIAPGLSIGPFFQASKYSAYDDSRAENITFAGIFLPSGQFILPGTYAASEKIKIKDIWDFNAGLGIQGKVGAVMLYAGPFLYWSRARLEDTLTLVGTSTLSVKFTADYESKRHVGGFAGLRIPLSRSLMLDAEAQLRSELSAGASLTYAFGARPASARRGSK